jgi:hypothetical protein
MTSNAIPLTTFERRLKAGIIIGAAALASPFYGAIIAGVYALTAVTLTAMVCPRTWPLRLSGHAMVMALYLLLDKHIGSWAGYLPPAVFVFLCALQFFCTRPSGRWRPGTDLLIARIVERGEGEQNPTHISWLVFTHEDLDEDQLRTIFRKFCGYCPEPCFHLQRWTVVDICLRSVQFWYSQEEGRLLHRVSEWCAPHRHQPVEFEYRATPLERVDRFVSAFFGTTSLYIVLVALLAETDIVRGWVLMDMKSKIFLTAMFAVLTRYGYHMAMGIEELFDECISTAITSLTSQFESMSRFIRNVRSSIKRTYKAGVRAAKAAATRIRTCVAWTGGIAAQAVRTLANGTSKALIWMRPGVSWALGVVVNFGKAVARVVVQLLPVARGCLKAALTIVELVSTLIVLLAFSVVAFLLIDWLRELVSEVSCSTGARLFRL